MSNLKGKYLKLTKVSDDKFNGLHPNGVNVGHVLQGFNKFGIKSGEQLMLFISLKLNASPIAWTSVVKSFNKNKMVLKTANSTYNVEIKEEAEDEYEDIFSGLNARIIK